MAKIQKRTGITYGEAAEELAMMDERSGDRYDGGDPVARAHGNPRAMPWYWGLGCEDALDPRRISRENPLP